MDTLIAVILVTLVALCVVMVGWAVYRLWRAGICEEGGLLMQRVLEREGVSLESREDYATLARAVVAARRCVLCQDHDTCLAWLEGKAAIPLDHFCPNADLIAKLKAESAEFSAAR